MNKYYFVAALILFCLVFTNSSIGQDTTENHEIGLRTDNLNSFNIIYKKHKTDNSYSRLRLATGEIEIDDLSPFDGSISLGIAGGQENRRSLSDKLIFVTGIELMATLRVSLSNDKPSFSLTPGVGAVLGIDYLVGDKFIVGVETIPTASFNIGYRNSGVSISDLKISIANTYASLFVVYRFSK